MFWGLWGPGRVQWRGKDKAMFDVKLFVFDAGSWRRSRVAELRIDHLKSGIANPRVGSVSEDR
eukprot:473278-Heterocapsa_arctica.AAC.1